MEITVDRVDAPGDVARRCDELFRSDPVAATSVATALRSRLAIGPAPSVTWLIVTWGARVVGVLAVDGGSGRGALLIGDADRDVRRRAAIALGDAVSRLEHSPSVVAGDAGLVAACAGRLGLRRGLGIRAGISIQLQVFDPARGERSTRAAPEVRLAGEDDVSWLCDWFVGFDRATFDDGFEPEPAVRSKLGHLWLLEHAGRPVSMAAASPSAYGVRRIHAVYTPGAERGRGHGSAVTAAVVREVIDGGDRAVLFADLANSVTVPMYQRLGFDPVEEHVNWTIGQG